MSADFPYHILHELDDIDEKKEPKRYKETLHRLHVAIGVEQENVSNEDKEQAFINTVIDLNKQGYNKSEIMKKCNSSTRVHKIYKKYKLKNKPVFNYKVDGVYIENLATTQHWNIGWNTKYKFVKPLFEAKGISMDKHKYHWCDLPVGAKYILRGNIDKVLVKQS